MNSLYMHDLVIKGGKIVDGLGNPWFRGDLAIKDGKISSIGIVEGSVERVIDASGMVVSPGFIDSHSHSDLVLMSNPEAKAKIMQGVTTEVIGQDGLGEAPLRDDVVDMWRRYLSGLNGDPELDWKWRSFSDYLDCLEAAKPAVNIAALVGHGNIRLLAMGMDNRKPTPSEQKEMEDLLAKSLREGAVGLSTGLIYPPCVYSDTVELTKLCKVVAAYKGVFVVHMRNEGDRLLESIDEVVSVGRESGAPVHISHFKANGRQNWGGAAEALERVLKARRSGIDVTVDQYPYTAGSTFLGSLLPPWSHEGGLDKLLIRLRDPEVRRRLEAHLNNEGDEGSLHDWEKILITNVNTARNKQFEGKYLSQISKELGKSPATTVLDLVLDEENAATMASFSMHEGDVRVIMKSYLQMVCTDGIVLGKPHPRAYGSFPRVLGKYVREGVIELEEAVRKMTSLPAQRFGMLDRGILRPGLNADVTIFDSETVIDTATFENPINFPKGIKYVVVNGSVTVEDGEFMNNRAGAVFRRKS